MIKIDVELNRQLEEYHDRILQLEKEVEFWHKEYSKMKGMYGILFQQHENLNSRKIFGNRLSTDEKKYMEVLNENVDLKIRLQAAKMLKLV